MHGLGENVRDWLFVDDHTAALQLLFERRVPGGNHSVGGNATRRNLDVVRSSRALFDELRPTAHAGGYASLLSFVADLPGDDFRYAVDASNLQRELGWSATENFESDLRTTVLWYLENSAWAKRVQSG